MSSEDKGKSSPKRDRYWSVMLVGDHGRVIPFKHFKGLAIGVCVGFILMLIAIIVMAMLYTHQMKKQATLHSRLSEAQNQNRKLRDEKDLYLTRLMLKENKRTVKSEKPAPKAPDKTPPADPPQLIEEPKASTPAKPAPIKKKPVKQQWRADIRKFTVSYDAKQKILKAQFRIYNTSKPKKPLSGRSVIVFKVSDDPPNKWLSVPQVQLENGKPPASKGQPFQIRNYFTMRFRAYRQKAPIRYDAVTAYVFSTEGKLLASKDLAVKIDAPLPEKKEPPASVPVIEKKPEPAVQTELESNDDTPKEEQPTTPGAETVEPVTDPGTQTPKPDSIPQPQPDTEKDAAPIDKAPNSGVSDPSSTVTPPATEGQKEPLTTPKPFETVPKP